MVIAAAEPFRSPVPADAMHAAPMWAIDAVWVGAVAPFVIMSAMVSAATRPMIPEGIPVRGGAGAMTVPRGLLRGVEIGCGGAKAMPTPNTFAYAWLW